MNDADALADVPVLILAGGLGTRLRPLVADRPKALAPIGDQSFLEIQIGLLREQGARHFVLCVGHAAGQVQAALGNGARLGVHIDYSIEADLLLGTAGALLLAQHFISARALVLNGDTYLAADYQQILDHHCQARAGAGAQATLTLARLDEASRYGTILLDDSGRWVTGFREKNASEHLGGWLNAGAYVLERDILQLIPRGVPCSLERTVFPAALQRGMRVAAFRCARPFYDIGTPEDFQRFNRWFALSGGSRQTKSRRRAG